jgi:hypothetical protein
MEFSQLSIPKIETFLFVNNEFAVSKSSFSTHITILQLSLEFLLSGITGK